MSFECVRPVNLHLCYSECLQQEGDVALTSRVNQYNFLLFVFVSENIGFHYWGGLKKKLRN